MHDDQSATTVDRRRFLTASLTALAAAPIAGPIAGCVARPMPVRSPYGSMLPDKARAPDDDETLVNDVHSRLNATRVAAVVRPRRVDELSGIVARARRDGLALSVAGGRHAMGGQQFGDGNILVDMRALDQVVAFDADRGLVTIEAGIEWPALMRVLQDLQTERETSWGIAQKQTGADRLSIGGALACNAHGRGLTLGPIVQQVEAFDLVGPTGDVHVCSRTANPELFRLAIGGYGLFGIVSRVVLRLQRRVKVRRVVVLGETTSIAERFESRIRDGYLYGDYQFATDATRDSFLRRGVFSCYAPVPPDTPLTANPTRFHPEDWARLTFYSHKYKRRAFEVYSTRYLRTSEQVYWSDSQLSAAYVDDYHTDLSRALGARVAASEMISEIYVPRLALASFMADARDVLRQRRANVIYGTVRMIEQDAETFLAWARERYACIVFNLHVDHTPAAIEGAAETFRGLIDLGLAYGGSYYLTYHRWARRDQVERAYPQMARFLAKKRAWDPGEVFQSTWYRHHRALVSPAIG